MYARKPDLRPRASFPPCPPVTGTTSSNATKSSFFFQAEDGIRDLTVTGVQTCALPIWRTNALEPAARQPSGVHPRANVGGAAPACAAARRRVRRRALSGAPLRTFAGVRWRDRGLRRRDSRSAAAALLDRRVRAHGARVPRRRRIVSDEPAGCGGGARLMMPRVLHVVERFLPRSETFIYTIVNGHCVYEASVLCQSRLFETEFPFPRVHVHARPLSKRTVGWWVDASIGVATGRSLWRREIEAVLA